MYQYSYLVFEYNGNSRTLLNFLSYLSDNGIRLSEAAHKFLVLQLLGLFKFLAKEGYCHGDFKPDNILIVLTPTQGIRLMFIDMATMHQLLS
jgi:serine/threonine protein kinase